MDLNGFVMSMAGAAGVLVVLLEVVTLCWRLLTAPEVDLDSAEGSLVPNPEASRACFSAMY